MSSLEQSLYSSSVFRRLLLHTKWGWTNRLPGVVFRKVLLGLKLIYWKTLARTGCITHKCSCKLYHNLAVIDPIQHMWKEANFNICIHGSKTHLTLQCHLGAQYRPSSHAAAVSPPCGREIIWALYKFKIPPSWAVVVIKFPASLKN